VYKLARDVPNKTEENAKGSVRKRAD